MKDWIFIVALFLLLCFSGCTLHFKAKDVELGTEANQTKSNATFELKKADLL